ncbi:hypothetical protein BJV77DRAFT_145573 [Russula vinacea]|nr:hypothetical protein BJV77DRAFT_145573 [Russula vinacea]
MLSSYPRTIMTTVPSTSTSHSNFASIFNAALETYKRRTKKDLASHPLLPSLQSCDSPEAILTVLRDQIPMFRQSQNGDDGLMKWVAPTVNVLYSFSATIGGGVGLVFPSANAIFAGIGILLSAAKDASASQDKLIGLFNRIERYFRRLEIYTGIVPTTAMMEIVIEIMVEVLMILAIATDEVKCGRLKKYIKKLTGNTDIEDSLQRLDKLTLEEAQMASVELLKITHGIEGTVQDVRGNVQDVGNKVEGIDERVQGVGCEVRGVNAKLDQVNLNQLRDSLLRWLSPPDPSINHNIACKAQHDGTAEWFFQGSIFNHWKSTDPFLWIHGKPGSGKSVLWFALF